MAILALALSNVIVAALLAVPAWLAGLWGRRPALTHALWLLVLIKLVTPPLFECPIALPSMREPVQKEAENAVMDPAAPREEPADLPESPEPIAGDMEIAPFGPEIVLANPAPASDPVENVVNPPEPVDAVALWDAVDVLLLFWLAGSLGWVTLAVTRVWRFHRMVRFAQPAPAHVQEIASSLAWALQVRCPEIGMLAGNISPMLWGLGRSPRLLLPADLLDRLTPDQLATLLAHELAHWRRRDHRMRMLELAVLTIYWWCPLAWWARRQLHDAEEECCDAWVVSLLPESAKAYALALVETVDFLAGAPAPLPLAASGLGRVRFLKRRLTMILKGKTPRTLTFTGLLGVAAVGLLVLPLVFSRSQETQVGAQDETKKSDASRAEELDKAHAIILKMQKDLEKDMQQFQADMQKRQREMQKRAEELHKAMQRLHELDAPVPLVAGPGIKVKVMGPFPGGPPGGPFPGGPVQVWGTVAVPGGNVDQRLKQVETKLDTVLEELRAMRKAKQGGTRAAPGAPPNPAPAATPGANNRSGGAPSPALPATPRTDPAVPLDSALPK